MSGNGFVIVLPVEGKVIAFDSERNFWATMGAFLSWVYDAGQGSRQVHQLKPFVFDDGLMFELPDGSSIVLQDHPQLWTHIERAARILFDEGQKQLSNN